MPLVTGHRRPAAECPPGSVTCCSRGRSEEVRNAVREDAIVEDTSPMADASSQAARSAAAREPAGRSRVLAVVLSGLAPGAGHLFVGRPVRGLVLLVIITLAFAAWGFMLPRSWLAARLGLLPGIVLTLHLLVDSARLAPSAKRPARDRRWPRLAAYLGFVLLSGWLLPTAVAAVVEWRCGLVRQPDDHMMAAGVHSGDLVLIDRRAWNGGGPELGDVVSVSLRSGERTLRRVVALPGQRAEVWRGTVRRDGVDAADEFMRPTRRHDLFVDPMDLGANEYLVLSDRRHPEEVRQALVRPDQISGQARYVLLPGDWDLLAVGRDVR